MNDEKPTDTADLLFVYGTFRASDRHEFHNKALYLRNHSTKIATGRAHGRLYHIDYYPALALDSHNDWVTGDIVKLNDPDQILPELDAFEECGPNFPKPWEFRRVILPVETDQGLIDCWVYVYNWPVTGLPLIKSGDWFNR